MIVNIKNKIQSIIDDKEFKTALQEYMNKEIENAKPTASITFQICKIPNEKMVNIKFYSGGEEDDFTYNLCLTKISNITNLKDGWEYLLDKLDEFGLKFNVKTDLPDNWNWDINELEIGYYFLLIIIYLNV